MHKGMDLIPGTIKGKRKRKRKNSKERKRKVLVVVEAQEDGVVGVPGLERCKLFRGRWWR